MEIRDAEIDDAQAACQVLRQSISELCIADHQNDPTILEQWLSNKTPAIVSSWILNPSNSVILAVEQGAIVGVGAVTKAGHVYLNYVAPDARFRGVSRTLLAALEATAKMHGNVRCSLNSTDTAYSFYLRNGYVTDGPPTQTCGTGGYPMSKHLVLQNF